jgi:hypothetical protein
VLSSDQADDLRRVQSALAEAYAYIISLAPKLEKPVTQPDEAA